MSVIRIGNSDNVVVTLQVIGVNHRQTKVNTASHWQKVVAWGTHQRVGKRMKKIGIEYRIMHSQLRITLDMSVFV